MTGLLEDCAHCGCPALTCLISRRSSGGPCCDACEHDERTR